jgi:hypothetical protein
MVGTPPARARHADVERRVVIDAQFAAVTEDFDAIFLDRSVREESLRGEAVLEFHVMLRRVIAAAHRPYPRSYPKDFDREQSE